VARAALDAGASVVNDVWALARDPALAALVAERGATIVLMHNGWPVPLPGGTMGRRPEGRLSASPATPVRGAEHDVVETVGEALAERAAAAEVAGVARDRLIVDPGIGFGKRPAESILLLRRLGELKARPGLRGLPLLVGTSRKGFIGRTLGLPLTERLEGTLATLALAIAQGADLVRVHDVRASVRCCRMADAIVRAS
jgi:dihydropteroate synthase